MDTHSRGLLYALGRAATNDKPLVNSGGSFVVGLANCPADELTAIHDM